MKLGIIGSSQVAQTVGKKLLELGHNICISSRNPDAVKDRGDWGTVPSANQWKAEMESNGHKASAGSFAEAGAFGEVILNCTFGLASVEALSSAGASNLRGKILVDISNPLDFSQGFPPSLAFCNTESLGERIQVAFPDSKVVKALNTVSANIMINPGMLPEKHDAIIAGNDTEAKQWVTDTLLKDWFGWKSVIDLGDITNARATEMYLPLWLRLFGSLQNPNFNIKIVKA